MPHHQLLQGAQEFIVCIISFFVGVLSYQCWCYFRSDHEDSILLRGLVALLWILELAGMALRWQGLYLVSTRRDRGLGSFEDPLLTLVPVLMNSFNGPLVQAYYIYRIYVFSGHRILPALCWLLSFGLFAVNLATTTGLTISGTQLRWKPRWDAGYIVTMALGATIDVIITAILCYSLFTRRREAGVERTAKLIDGLIAWTIKTGLATSIFAVSALVTFLVCYDSYSWLYLAGILSRVYPNTMVATLNARSRFREIAKGTIRIDAATDIYISPGEIAQGGGFLVSPAHPATIHATHVDDQLAV